MQHVFEAAVERCITEGLVEGKNFAVDVSLIEADVNIQRSKKCEDWNPADIDPEDARRIGTVSGPNA